MNRHSAPALKSSPRSFTLLELIVVIVILGILATLGYTQYTKVVEKGRQAEARVNLGAVRQSLIAYKLTNNTLTGISSAYVNLGTGADEIPSACRATHYFYYKIATNSDYADICACRCTSGGRAPQGTDMYNQSLCRGFVASATQVETEVPHGWYLCP
ncbi:MAG: prepilin-type N-terminal cleavage/methylation domain-containing protein [Candidatus Omnitrophica bacterium]|nr:prepilin-type N-terminal cleavage/methylation domain-containing protein [Candidatus Omnitrophota bacterium]